MTSKARRFTLLTAVTLLALVVFVRVDRARGRATAPTLGETPPSVRTAVVRLDRVEHRFTLEAELRAADAADVAAEVGGRVVERLIEPGDQVRRGQPLLRLDDAAPAAEAAGRAAELAAARARVVAAAAELDFAETSVARDRTLFAGGAISRQDLDRAELARERAAAGRRAAEEGAVAAEEALRGVRERLADTVVRAPWDGAVVSVEVAPGDLATAGRPLARLVREGPYRVVARLPQETAARLVPGSPVVVSGGGGELPARVSRVAAGLDRSGLAVVEADLPERPA
ncbi:MAG TPA: efflux RND transporter periplasmic adaptor subunit, partial [Thermoanaerobaculia bacterium]